MILFPPAKINIGLNVVERRIDGYHELETIMVPISLYDILEILPSETFVWRQSGLLINEPVDSNLCVKAFKLIQEAYHIGNVYMHLKKSIPMGAGLGGGSADAAYVIRGLNELFKLEIPTQKQKELASQLGSDCAFFIENSPQLAVGRGDQLAPFNLDLRPYHLVLIKPSIHINTAQAYNGVFISGDKGNLTKAVQSGVENWKHTVKNDFEHHLFAIYPELHHIKEALYQHGAIYASMSGSGSSMYGIFEEQPAAFHCDDCEVYSLTF